MARLYFARYEVYSVGGIISSYLCDTFSHGDVKKTRMACLFCQVSGASYTMWVASSSRVVCVTRLE